MKVAISNLNSTVPRALKIRSAIGPYIAIATPFLIAIIAVLIWGKQPTEDDFQVVILFSIIPCVFWVWFATLKIEINNGMLIYSEFFIKHKIPITQIQNYRINNKLKRSGPTRGFTIIPCPESGRRKITLNTAPFKNKEFKMFISILNENGINKTQ